MRDFFHWLETQYAEGNIELSITCEGIDYDKKICYNPVTDIMLAEIYQNQKKSYFWFMKNKRKNFWKL